MTLIVLKPRVKKFIETLPLKHKRQVKDYIIGLQTNPEPHDARPLIEYSPFLRADIGEYRIIYHYDLEQELITIVLAGKRNGDEIYRAAKRLLG